MAVHAADAAAAAPNRFQPILLRAMRAAAEENRNAMLAGSREEAEAVMTRLHAHSAAESETLHRVASNEIAAIAAYAKAEVERITNEADQAIAARRAQLGQGLEEQAVRVEQEIDTVRSRVAAFEADMAAFFGRLDQMADPTEFASLTAQLPEPPTLRDADDTQSSEPPRLHEAGDVSPSSLPSNGAQEPGGISLSAAPWSADRRSPAVPTVPPVAVAEATPAPITPASPLAAATAAEAAPPAPTLEATGSAPAPRPTGEPVITTIVVAGLVNIASIAAFKRLVSGLHGVQSVAVSSGPGGEFVFKVTHAKGIPLGDEVTLLPGFGARIVDSREGVLQVSARDPGAAA